MQHQGSHARRKHYRNKLCKEDFLYKTTTVVTTSRYHSTAGRSTAGSMIWTHKGVVYLMNIKMLHYALLYLITWVCQINQTSLLKCYFWVLWLLLNQGTPHCITTSFSLKSSTCRRVTTWSHVLKAAWAVTLQIYCGSAHRAVFWDSYMHISTWFITSMQLVLIATPLRLCTESTQNH